MQRFVCLILLLLIGTYASQAQQKQHCKFDEIVHDLEQNSPEYRKVQQQIATQSANFSGQKQSTIFVIPTVIHVIYDSSGHGSAAPQNISEAQILSQLEVMNVDYRKRNPDTTNNHPMFPQADVRIEFCLARRDPNGAETNGITRTATNIQEIGSSNQYYQVAPIWDREKYLNIWVCEIDALTAGFAFPPGSPSNRDGVVIDYRNFGTIGTVIAPYDKGRTATHEVGHWLNLRHPWGPFGNAACSVDDGIADTPNQDTIYINCPTHPQVSCNSADMIANYMGYVDDRCMGAFTPGQSDAMRLAIVSSRTNLILSNGCLSTSIEESLLAADLTVYPNPANTVLTIEHAAKLQNLSYQLFDLAGKAVNEAIISQARKVQLSTEDLPNGLYFLSVQDGKSVVQKKILILH